MKLLTAFAALLLAAPALAVPAETVARVIDGDTFTLSAKWSPYPLVWQVRVLGIDTPEKGHLAKCAEEAALSKRASDFTANMIAGSGGKVLLTDVSHDKYGGRLDARVSVKVGGKSADLATLLIAGGYARPYSGEGPKPDWCAILKGEQP